jgi:uncharacterized protein YigA (DUF484 family)
MSNKARGIHAAVVDDATVASYLEAFPDFFERHPQVLAKLRLLDPRGDATVSLIERQVEVLREKNRQLDRRFAELVENARANEALSDRIHRLARRLAGARDRLQAVAAIEASLREDFDAGHSVLTLFSSDAALRTHESRFLRVVRRDDLSLKSFEPLLASGKPRCGQVRDSQRDWLFGAGTVEVGSVALVPLGPGGSVGLLACGSTDVNRFNPLMSTDFLVRIAELVAAAVAGP